MYTEHARFKYGDRVRKTHHSVGCQGDKNVPVGSLGTVTENNDDTPWVKWDCFQEYEVALEEKYMEPADEIRGEVLERALLRKRNRRTEISFSVCIRIDSESTYRHILKIMDTYPGITPFAKKVRPYDPERSHISIFVDGDYTYGSSIGSEEVNLSEFITIMDIWFSKTGNAEAENIELRKEVETLKAKLQSIRNLLNEL